MFPDELFGDRWICRHRRGYGKGIGDDKWLESTPIRKWKLRGGDSAGGIISGGVSARKLAASLWRMCAEDDGSLRRRCGYPLSGRLDFEGITKWDLCYSKTLVAVSPPKRGEITAIASIREPAALRKPQKHLNELGGEVELRKKLSSRIKKLDEDRSSRTKTDGDHGMRSMVKSLTVDIKREREKCKKLDIVNTKLLSDITKTKLSTRKLVQCFEREKKARRLLEHECGKLAKVVKGNKADIVELRNQCTRIKRDAEEGRKMMQLGEVWLEEQAQRMLLDAKFLVEEKQTEMNDLIADVEAFLSQTSTSKNVLNDTKESNHAFDPQVTATPRKNILANGLASGISGYCDTNGKQIAADCSRDTLSDLSSMSPKQSKKKGSINDRRRTSPRNNVHTHNTLSSTAPISCPQTALQEGAGDNNGASLQQRNPHVDRAIKGHIMWPRGVQRHDVGAKHLQERLESQRMLIRNVLKQRC